MAKNAAAVELGRRGGEARRKALTPERRREIARLAAQARYAKASKNGTPLRRKQVA